MFQVVQANIFGANLNEMEPFKLSVLIVEDNLSFALELQMQVEELGYNVLGRVDNSAEALDTILSEQPDIILMDIDIKGKLTGAEIGERIRHLNIPILFITSFGDDAHYAAAQKSNMVGYLVKPVDKYSLRTALQLAFQNAQQPKPILNPDRGEGHFLSKDYLFFKKKEAYHKVPIRSIAFIRSSNNYCETITDQNETFITRINISQMEELLPQKDFMRTHRQYIVRLDKIDAVNFQDNTLKVAGEELPVSRGKRGEIAAMIRTLS